MEIKEMLMTYPLPLVVKIGTIIGLAFYIFFAFIVVRQVQQMTNTLEVGFETPLRFIAWLHLLIALTTLLLAVVIL